MIKEAMFCDICGRHVHDNTSVSFYTVYDKPVPIVGVRTDVKVGKDQIVHKDDISFCEFCEIDIFAILQNRAVKRDIEKC